MHQIAAVMIARNEERCITRSLESIRPYVDELIVLDTGSTDNTMLCAQNAGATVHCSAWQDDFSKARNTALAYSNSQWNLIIDADEYLISGGDLLKSIADHPPSYVGAIAIESTYIDNGRSHSVRNWLTRLLPNTVRFAGRVHEQPIHQFPVKNLAIEFGHDGYLPQQHAYKRGRNEQLLNAELQHSPQDAYLHFQLGKEKETAEAQAKTTADYAKAVTEDPTRKLLGEKVKERADTTFVPTKETAADMGLLFTLTNIVGFMIGGKSKGDVG